MLKISKDSKPRDLLANSMADHFGKPAMSSSYRDRVVHPLSP